MIYDSGGLKAVYDAFDIEILDVLLISNNYETDKFRIEVLEDVYKSREDKFKLYNDPNKGGEAGGHSKYYAGNQPEYFAYTHGDTIYERRNNKVRQLIAEGFSLQKICKYMHIPYSSSNIATIDGIIRDACDGKGYTEARYELMGEHVEEIVLEGYFTLPEIATFFAGMDSADAWIFITRRDFNFGVNYVRGLVSSIYLKLVKLGITPTYSNIHELLEIRGLTESVVSKFLGNHMKSISRIHIDDIIEYLKFYASIIILHSTNAYDFLNRINYDKDLIPTDIKEINLRIENLFGSTFEEAKLKYTSKFIGIV